MAHQYWPAAQKRCNIRTSTPNAYQTSTELQQTMVADQNSCTVVITLCTYRATGLGPTREQAFGSLQEHLTCANHKVRVDYKLDNWLRWRALPRSRSATLMAARSGHGR